MTELVPEKEPDSKDLTDSFEDHFVINRAEPAMDVQEEIPFDDALHLEPVQTPASQQENEMSSEHAPAADPMIENSPEIKQEHSRKKQQERRAGGCRRDSQCRTDHTGTGAKTTTGLSYTSAESVKEGEERRR